MTSSPQGANTVLLSDWVAQQLVVLSTDVPQSPKAKPLLSPLNGDAGFRRYFRVNGGESGTDLLAVHSPPDKEKNREFAAIAQYWRSQSIPAPQIIAVDFERGFLLLEDFGPVHLSHVLNDEPSADVYYRKAMELLLPLQMLQEFDLSVPGSELMLQIPLYDEGKLREELSLLHLWFIPRLLQYELSVAEQAMIEQVYGKLIASAQAQPQVWVHRDFHCRNLLCRSGASDDVTKLGVIDFQDAVRGPITYDLVSLLKDCYLRWPKDKVVEWALFYADQLKRRGMLAPNLNPDIFMRWFDWMGLQRHLKVLGIFARLWLRDGKSGYLKDLPLVIRYVLEVTGSNPEFEEFHHWFIGTLIPLCEQQDWYRNYHSAGELL